jgi:hypothetical protein
MGVGRSISPGLARGFLLYQRAEATAKAAREGLAIVESGCRGDSGAVSGLERAGQRGHLGDYCCPLTFTLITLRSVPIDPRRLVDKLHVFPA